MQVLTLKFTDITTHADLQIRKKGLDHAHVEDICRAFQSKDKSKRPEPGRVYNVDGIKYVTRGHHRIAGAESAGLDRLPFEVFAGTFEDARLDAIASNAGNGLKYTNEDKRNAVEQCLDLRPGWTQEEVADWCGVSQKFVSDIFAERAALAVDELEADTEPVNKTPGEFTPGINSDAQEQRVSKRNRKGEGRPNQKQQDGAKVGKALKRDANRTDEEVASETGTKVDFVARIRKSLEKKNLIESRATHPVPASDTSPEPPRKSVKVVPPPEVDGWGIPVQEHATQAFAAVPKFKELVAAIQSAQKLFNEVTTGAGGAFLRLPSASSFRRGKKGAEGEDEGRYVHTGLEQALQHVKAAMPKQTVCPYQYAEAGHPADCRTCLNLNWTPELSPSVPPVCIDRAKIAFGPDGKEVA